VEQVYTIRDIQAGIGNSRFEWETNGLIGNISVDYTHGNSTATSRFTPLAVGRAKIVIRLVNSGLDGIFGTNDDLKSLGHEITFDVFGAPMSQKLR